MSEAWKQWEGRSVDNRFPLRQLLGASSHSAVFLTESVERGGVKAAIKLLAANGPAGEAQIARWRHVARLSHPNLVPLYHYGRARLGDLELVFAVMEFADETLAEILPSRPLTPEETKQMLLPVLDALTFLHQRGLVHGDIQPSNILAVGETIKLSSDTVRQTHDLGNGSRQRVSPDPGPEVMGSVEPAGDIYSLGVTLTQALTQKSPFDSSSTLGHSAEPLPPPFDDIVLHALHPDPQLRWTAADIALRLSPSAPANVRAPASPANSAAKAVAAGAAAPAASAPKAAQKRPSEAKSEPRSPERPAPVKAVKDIVPTSVPLSPVTPLRRKSGGSGSLLRYTVTAGVAAVLVFAAVRGLRHGGNTDQANATLAEKAPAPAAPTTETAVPAEKKATARPVAAAEPPAAVRPERAPEERKTEPVPRSAVEAKAQAPETPEPAPAAVKSEVRAAPATASGSSEVLQQVMPDISQKALATIRGTVRLTVRVQADAAGNVGDAELAVPSGSSFFNDAALRAARRWQFQPESSGSGEPRSYLLQFEFTPAGPTVSVSRAE